MPEAVRLRLGTRGSALARAQTERVAERVRAVFPHVAVETVVVRTEGDTDKTTPLTLLGGRGVFTSGPEAALLDGSIDAAVHSAKDMPTRLPDGCVLAAFPEREAPEDVFVSRHGVGLDRLPSHPVIGTSSRRREVQVRAARPDAIVVDLRGNIDTRLRRALDETRYDGIVLAAAGLDRMGWSDRATERLPVDRFVPSPAQGALAVEIRADDARTAAICAVIDAPRVRGPVLAERAFLRALGAGCSIPVGALATLDGDELLLRAMLASEDGATVVWDCVRLDRTAPETHAAEVALRMRERTARPAQSFRANGGGGRSDQTADARGRVLVTRPAEQAAGLSAALRQSGFDPVACPTIAIGDPADWAAVDGALRAANAGEFAWVVVTSANAGHRLAERLDALALGGLGPAKVAAVGSATAESMAGHGIGVDVVPPTPDAAGLASALMMHGVSGRQVLYLHGSMARDALPTALAAAGALVTAVETYRTVPATTMPPEIMSSLRRGEIGVLTFASPSSVTGLCNGLAGDLANVASLPAVCVGEVTAEAARAAGFRAVVVADEPSGEAMAAAVAKVATRGSTLVESGSAVELAAGRAGGGA